MKVKHLSLAISAASIVAVASFFSPAYAGGKTLTVVLSEEPDIVDPCEATRSNVGRIIMQNVAETLVEIDPKDGSIKARLATSWKQTDNLTWEFNIRKGVKFHDGADLNAKTVVKSIKRALNPKYDCEARTKFFGNISVTPSAVGSHTVAIKTKTPQPIMPAMMGIMSITSPNTQEAKGERNPQGTGPYVFGKWTPGQSVTLKRFSGYWGSTPVVEDVMYVFRKESAVRAAMVKTGEADIAPNIAVQDATDPKMDFSYFNSETARLRIDMSQKPLDDIRLRKAMNLAIDLDALRGTIFAAGVVPQTQIVVPSINGHNPRLKPWPYNLAEAKKLVAAAKADGVDVGKEIVIIGRLGIYPNSTEAMEAMHAMLSEAGFNLKIKMMETAGWLNFLSRPYAEDRGPTLVQGQHDNNNGDAVFSMYNKYACEGAQSTTCDSKVEAGIKAATAATGDKRRDTWQEVQRRLHQDIVPDVQMFHMVGFSRVNPRIDFTPSIATNSQLQVSQVKFN
jgi:peptide/nickel transport system substrate-binding protein|tara:strand:- start:4094 stop:5614 length:1521 start_codon:yes stop_codon:yes gene_type:complete